MGKNRVIRSLGKIIGNLVVHKITFRHGNIKESKGHTSKEIISYRDNAIEVAQEFNWNDYDKSKIKQIALREFNKKMNTKYSDIKYPKAEVNETINKTINECI